ncbi:hypothetical protein GCM10009672_03700 [Nesterenkonia lutea]
MGEAQQRERLFHGVRAVGDDDAVHVLPVEDLCDGVGDAGEVCEGEVERVLYAEVLGLQRNARTEVVEAVLVQGRDQIGRVVLGPRSTLGMLPRGDGPTCGQDDDPSHVSLDSAGRLFRF